MTSDEMAGRLLVLETFSMTALSMFLSSGDDPGHGRARALLDHLRGAAVRLGADISPEVEKAAQDYGERMAGLILRNL